MVKKVTTLIIKKGGIFMKFNFNYTRRAILVVATSVGLAMTAGASLAEKVKVGAVYTLPVEQQWISRIHKALNAASDRGEVEYVFSENVANTDYERVMREYAEQGMHMIVGEVFGLERAARKVAKDYPGTAFLMGSSFGPVSPNFAVFDNWIHEPSYLSGMIAGAETKSNVIGMVGGYAIPEVNRLMHAFMDGAKEVNPNVKFLVSFLDSWYDPPKAKESSFAMIDAGADIMFAERFGVADAAVERGVKAVGNVIDTSGDYPGTILASALWHFEATIDKAVSKVASGNFEAVDYGQYSFMGFGGGSLVVDESLVSSDVMAEVRVREAEIMGGMFRVNVNDARPISDK
jgi:basic membrane protein A